MILALRTDKPKSEVHLFGKNELIDNKSWLGDRSLADNLLEELQKFLDKNKLKLNQLSGIIIFTGEGSFTGLRIGTTVANTIAYSYGIPIIEARGKDWLKVGLKKLPTATPGRYVTPTYHSQPNISRPKAL